MKHQHTLASTETKATEAARAMTLASMKSMVLVKKVQRAERRLEKMCA
jgi:hypothetical protein